MEGVPAGRGRHPQPQPGGVPPPQHPVSPQGPAREGPPGPARGKRRLPRCSRFRRKREERALLRSQTRCGGEIIFYQVADRTGGTEICRTEAIYSYLRRFGRGATKAPSSSKKKKKKGEREPSIL